MRSPRTIVRRARLWLRSVLMRRRLEREMREEISQHLDRASERLAARGLPPEEARRAALREFGNVGWHEERARDARGGRGVEALLADLRFALRQFGRRPWTTLTMFVVLAGGMSISALLFTWVHAYSVQPPVGIEAEGLVRIRGSVDAGVYGRGVRPLSEEELGEYRSLTDHFEAVAGWADATAAVDVGEDPSQQGLLARVSFVTDDYFPLLGVRPVIGPGLPTGGAADPADAGVAVINHLAWERVFGGDPGVIGSTVSVNGVPVTIVGVAPERFLGVNAFGDFKLWLPLAARGLVLPEAARRPAAELDPERARAELAGLVSAVDATADDFRAVARLRPGVGAEAAAAAVEVVVERRAAADPELRDRGPGTEIVPLLSANGDPMFDRDVRLMTAAVGLLGLLVLGATCTNVSALLTGLAMARRQEIAVRLSLGAGRRRLVRQLLTESVLLAVLAAGAALGAVWLVMTLAERLVPQIPFAFREIGGVTTAFTFGVALAVGVAFGLSPALHATRLALAGVLRDSAGSLSAGRARLQRGLVVAQIAFTQPLIVMLGAVLLVVFGAFQPQAPTPDADRLITLSIRPTTPILDDSAAGEDARAELRFAMERLVERLAATPGVEAAVIDWGSGPALGSYRSHPDDARGIVQQQTVELAGERAALGTLAVKGMALVRGRDFGPADAGGRAAGGGAEPGGGVAVGSEVPAIVGADLTQRLWGGLDPIGRRLVPSTDTATALPTLVVVGVTSAAEAERRGPQDPYAVLVPADAGRLATSVIVRTAGPAEPLLPTVRRVALEEAPGTIPSLSTVAAVEEAERRTFRLAMGGVAGAGAVALLLSALGLYAVIAFSVGQRTREIAVRMAVGAGGGRIVRRYVADGLRLGAIGMAIGLPLSVIGLRLVMVDPDVPRVPIPSVTAIAVVGVLVVAAAAAWIPARRAASVDVAGTLRRD